MSSNVSRPAVLLVEDEVLVRIVMADFLLERGLEVLEAGNAQEALDLLEQRKDIRAIFTDVAMPGDLNGVGLARLIRVRWPGIGVIVTTGGASAKLEDLPAGCHFVPKPYDHARVTDQLYELALAQV